MMKTISQYTQGDLVLYWTDNEWWPTRVREYQKAKKRLVLLYLDQETAST